MSEIRDTFFANKAITALWDVAVSMKRGNPLPLDASAVFESYAALEAYIADKESVAYPGQIIAVVNVDSTGIYYLDQDLAIQEVGKIPSADNKSIEVADGVISMYNYGKYYYKYIPEVLDEETNEVIVAASYEKTEVSEIDVWAAGLEPRVVSEDGELVIGWFEPNPTTVDGVKDQVTTIQGTVTDLDEQLNKEGGLVDQVEDLQEEIGHAATEAGNDATGLYVELDKKANAADVYTKSETDVAIATAVSAADHLKRKIVENYEAIQTYINEHTDAEQYIFMVPTVYVYTSESNKYDEYVVLKSTDAEGNSTYTIEPVGNWVVDLADYVSETELENYLKTYYTKTEANDLLDNKVSKEEGKSLVSDTEIAKLATVEANAEENFIKSVTERFNVSENGQLSFNSLSVNDIEGLETALDNKVNKVVYNVPVYDENGDPVYEEDGVTQKIEQIEGTLLSPEDQEKLAALVIGDEGVQISGKVNAENVEGLATWITNNRATISGLFSAEDETKLDNIEAGAQKNFITVVEDSQFTVTNGKLAFADAFNQQMSNLTDASTLQVNKIANLENIVNGYTDDEGNSVEGLASVVNNFASTYVALSDFNSVVGDLNQMKSQSVNLWSDVKEIQEALKWQTMTE